MQAIGARRFVVYGDTGYDLRGWLPGDTLAATQSLAELRDGRLYRNRAMLQGLPTNEGGYVPAEMALGGLQQASAWLLLASTRYAPFESGTLFEREVEGFVLGRAGWQRLPGELPVDMPAEAASLPPLDPSTLCGSPELRFLALGSATTAAGGVLVAGQCDDRKPVKGRTELRVAHGRPHGSHWAVTKLPAAAELDGIVNLALYARSDDDAWLTAYEPFRKLNERRHYLAHYDGTAWTAREPDVDDALMSIAGSVDGTLWAAGSRALYRQRPGGAFEKVALPGLRFAKASAAELHVHTVRAFAPDEIWVEASYRVALPAPNGKGSVPSWATALYGTRTLSAPYYCDARERAEQALVEIEGAR